MTGLLTEDELEAALRDIGRRRYHRLHPFHHLLHGGKCTKGQVQAWALNRYYYQAMIPIKDASLIARCPDSDLRREWRSRLVDHDGTDWSVLDQMAVASEGAISEWRLAADRYECRKSLLIDKIFGRGTLKAQACRAQVPRCRGLHLDREPQR